MHVTISEVATLVSMIPNFGMQSRGRRDRTATVFRRKA